MEKTTLAELPDKLGSKFDLFLCCASFEERCLSVAMAISVNKPLHTLLLHSVKAEPAIEADFAHLKHLLGDNAQLVRMDTTNPLLTADAIITALAEHASTSHTLLVDITTLTHEVLLILLRILTLPSYTHLKIVFAYASAKDYSPGLTEPDKWLSKSVKEVRSVLGYPGELLPSRPTHLIVLAGYEHERATALIQTYEAPVLSLGYGKPSSATDLHHEPAMKHFHDLLGKTMATRPNVFEFDFSCNNPWDTKRAVLLQSGLRAEHNVVVAPMNTKLSTVGCALAALEDDTLQICYAEPLQYNPHYSTPGDTCYLFELPELHHNIASPSA